MGWLTDLLKEIPLSAVLKERITDIEARHAATETENAILKDDLREAKAEIAKLKKQVEELSHKDDLDETEIGILLKMSEIGVDAFASEIIHLEFPMPKSKLEYYLNRLYAAGYASVVFGDDNGPHYAPTQQGLELLVRKNLI